MRPSLSSVASQDGVALGICMRLPNDWTKPALKKAGRRGVGRLLPQEGGNALIPRENRCRSVRAEYGFVGRPSARKSAAISLRGAFGQYASRAGWGSACSVRFSCMKPIFSWAKRHAANVNV